MSNKAFLAVDFGASTLKVAEFDITADGSLALLNYGIEPLGLAGSQDAAREGVVIKALQKLISEQGFTAKNINVCAPGFHVFSKFVKLPPVDSGKLNQIIEYEARQNVPFPLEEVVWDYQILGTTAGGELEVLLVAVKSDIVEGLFRSGDAAGLKLQLVDVSPAALCNAFRFNYGELEGCTMLLDIGAKTSNLLFFEGEKIYARSINIGANAITQEFAAEAKLPFARAEEIKKEEGFVSLGGAYEEPENAHQAAISKIARQVMTRLHIQVNQTLGFYRQQQGGSAPARLFLSGGGSIMPYTAQFFSEKLNVPVEYFNPFRNIQLDETMDLEELAKVAHSYGEVVGLALRDLAQCPVEMNLMPKTLLQRQKINQKKPYLIAAVVFLVVAVLGFGFLYSSLASVKQDALRDLEAEVVPLAKRDKDLSNAIKRLEAAHGETLQLSAWMREKYYWIQFYNELHDILAKAEVQYESELGVPVGVWVDKLVTQHPNMNRMSPLGASGAPKEDTMMMDERFLDRYGLKDKMATKAKKKTKKSAADFILSETDTNSISTVALVFRAVDVTELSGDPSAKDRIAYGLLELIKQSELVSTNGTSLGGAIDVDSNSGTVSFPLNIKLKNPLSL